MLLWILKWLTKFTEFLPTISFFFFFLFFSSNHFCGLQHKRTSHCPAWQRDTLVAFLMGLIFARKIIFFKQQELGDISTEWVYRPSESKPILAFRDITDPLQETEISNIFCTTNSIMFLYDHHCKWRTLKDKHICVCACVCVYTWSSLFEKKIFCHS